MNAWSLLLCEGPHDQEFLCSLATVGHGWVHEKRRPAYVPATYNIKGPYLFLTSNSRCLVVANQNGIDNILGEKGTILVDGAREAKSIGIILDADDKGVATRTLEVQSLFSGHIQAAVNAEACKVVPANSNEGDQRKFGLWVAPDCVNNGQLDDIILLAANEMHPTLAPVAENFVTTLGEQAGHDWTQFQKKATLGSLGQLWRAG